MSDNFSSVSNDLKNKSKTNGGNVINQQAQVAINPQKIDLKDKNLLSNLNKLDNATVTAVKEQMDLEFNKKRLTKEDPNFVYDKEVEFDQNDSNDWDD